MRRQLILEDAKQSSHILTWKTKSKKKFTRLKFLKSWKIQNAVDKLLRFFTSLTILQRNLRNLQRQSLTRNYNTTLIQMKEPYLRQKYLKKLNVKRGVDLLIMSLYLKKKFQRKLLQLNLKFLLILTYLELRILLKIQISIKSLEKLPPIHLKTLSFSTNKLFNSSFK